jgi:two-component system sensor histidine kinase TctE
MQLSRRRFFNDAAHQLKTPLAVIQAESELAQRGLDGVDANSAGPRRHGVHLRRLNRAVQQAVRIVQQLLSLSRLDADSGYTVRHAAVPLHKVARSVTLDWSPVARSRGIDLGFEQETRVDVTGQSDLLAELVGNLIDNAIRYSGDGSVITVRVACEHGEPLLQVIDNGPGIAASERDAVFERFYRSEATQAVEGSGLGLSIVREIARVHGARVELGDARGGGLVVSVWFPALVQGAA